MEINQQIVSWQSSGYEVGLIKFLKSDAVHDNFTQTIPTDYLPIGLCECEAVCISKKTGEIVLLEHEAEGEIFCEAAESQSSFISSISVLEDHFGKCIESDDYYNDEAAAVNVRNKCTNVAGGEKYISFYISIVGY